jgi:hypothetical protein
MTVFESKSGFVHENFAREYNFQSEGALVSTYQELIKRRAME